MNKKMINSICLGSILCILMFNSSNVTTYNRFILFGLILFGCFIFYSHSVVYEKDDVKFTGEKFLQAIGLVISSFLFWILILSVTFVLLGGIINITYLQMELHNLIPLLRYNNVGTYDEALYLLLLIMYHILILVTLINSFIFVRFSYDFKLTYSNFLNTIKNLFKSSTFYIFTVFTIFGAYLFNIFEQISIFITAILLLLPILAKKIPTFFDDKPLKISLLKFVLIFIITTSSGFYFIRYCNIYFFNYFSNKFSTEVIETRKVLLEINHSLDFEDITLDVKQDTINKAEELLASTKDENTKFTLYETLGNYYYMKGNKQKGGKYLEQAVKIAPQMCSSGTYLNLYAYKHFKKEKTIDVLNSAIKYYPNSIFSLKKIGYLREIDKPSICKDIYYHSEIINPYENSVASIILTRILIRNECYDKAQKLINAYKKTASNEFKNVANDAIPAHLKYGKIFMLLVSQLSPKSQYVIPVLNNNKAGLYRYQGNYDKAIELYRKTKNYTELVYVYADKGNFADAEEYLKKIDKDNDLKEAKEAQLYLLYKQGKYKDFEKAYKYCDNCQSNIWLLDIYNIQKDCKKGMAQANLIQKEKPQPSMYLLNIPDLRILKETYHTCNSKASEKSIDKLIDETTQCINNLQL